jgi:hypothetical protein
MTDSNCVSSAYCQGGTCNAKLAAGAMCTTSNQCINGMCSPTAHTCN